MTSARNGPRNASAEPLSLGGILTKRWLVILPVVLCALGMARLAAAEAVTPEQYVVEFLTPDRSPIAPGGWSPEEQLIGDGELAQRLRAKDSGVAAVVILNAGIHPRWTVVFVEEGESVRFIATLTYWGEIQEKRVGALDKSQFDGKIPAALKQLDCRNGLPGKLLMRGIVYWEGEEPRFCEAEIFGDAVLGPIVEPWLAESAEVRFTVFED